MPVPHHLIPPMNKLVTFLAFLSVAAMIFALSRGALSSPPPAPQAVQQPNG